MVASLSLHETGQDKIGWLGRLVGTFTGVGSFRRLAFLVSVVVCVMTMMLLVLIRFGVSSFLLLLAAHGGVVMFVFIPMGVCF